MGCKEGSFIRGRKNIVFLKSLLNSGTETETTSEGSERK